MLLTSTVLVRFETMELMNKPRLDNRECKHHGIVEHVLQKRSKYGAYRCKTCMKEAVIRRRLKLKVMAVEYKDGKCERCSYNKCIAALEFHHLDPSVKSFGIAQKGWTRTWEAMKAELDKCILVCANCHREIEHGLEVHTG